MKKIFYLGMSIILLALASCSNSRITSSWKLNEQNADRESAANFKKIVVAGLFNDSNRAIRQEMEDQLVNDLQAEGYNAVSSLSLYGPKSFHNMSEEEVINELHKNGIDGVITISLVDKEKEKKFVAGPRYYDPYRPWGYRYYNPYRPYRGHYETNTSFVFETNMYDVKSKKMIYSVQSQSFSPATIGSMADSYSRSILKDMKKNNVLG